MNQGPHPWRYSAPANLNDFNIPQDPIPMSMWNIVCDRIPPWRYSAPLISSFKKHRVFGSFTLELLTNGFKSTKSSKLTCALVTFGHEYSFAISGLHNSHKGIVSIFRHTKNILRFSENRVQHEYGMVESSRTKDNQKNPKWNPNGNPGATPLVPNTMMNHIERPKKFFGLNLKRWQ
ncbi:hypothetical protein LXL04_028016 [Taraxacum kok-saghyz]